MGKKIFITYLLLLLILSSYGQEKKFFAIGIRTGYSKFAFNDELLTPFIYSKGFIPFEIILTEENSKKIELLEFSIAKLQMRPFKTHLNYINMTSIYINNINSRKKWALVNNKFIFIPGFGYTINYYSRQQLFPTNAYSGIDKLINNKLHEFYASGNIAFTANYIISDKNRVNISLALPLFSFILRPSYSGQTRWKINKENFVTINNYFLTRIEFEYKQTLSKHFYAGVSVGMKFYSVKIPYSYKSLEKNIKLGLYYEF